MTMRYHINLSGTLFVVLTLLVGLAAAQRPNNLVVWGFGVLLAMILVSGVVSAKMVRTLRVTRLETRSASSGSPLMVKYLVENLSRKRSVFALRLGEVLTSRSIKERFVSQRFEEVRMVPMAGCHASVRVNPRSVTPFFRLFVVGSFTSNAFESSPHFPLDSSTGASISIWTRRFSSSPRPTL